MKLVIIEGGENVGKTYLVDRLKKEFGNKIAYAKFPSPELMNKYSSVVTASSLTTPYDDFISMCDFVDDLIMEEFEDIEHDKHGIILIDRFHLSTIVYQYLMAITHKDVRLEKINNAYKILFNVLNITEDDMITYVLNKKYNMNEMDGRTEAQITNDNNSDIIDECYQDLLNSPQNYFGTKNIIVFPENDIVKYSVHGDEYPNKTMENGEYTFKTIKNYIYNELVK